jgi:hypothetical protein
MAPRALYTYYNFTTTTSKKKSTSKLVGWLLATSRFPEFRLVERYTAEAVQGVEALTAEAVRRADTAYYQRLADDALPS